MTSGSVSEPMPQLAPMARVTRAGATESWHLGAAAVVTPAGGPVARVGDPRTATFVRSSAKPFQAMALLAAGGEEAYGLDDADVALTCASHGGRTEHVERAAALLERDGFGVGDLLCGAHPPMDEEAARKLREAGREPTPLHNNCSGKHAGMLLACRRLGLPTADYVDSSHPLQERNLECLARFCRVDPSAVEIAVDGCSVPTYRLPLESIALGYAALAHPDGAEHLAPEDRVHARRVVRAMAAAPEMVAGAGRFTTRLIEVTGGRVVGKEGAEGFYGVAVRGPAAFGLALKIADGADRCRDGVVLELLRLLGALSGEEVGRLESHYRPERRNHRDIVIGRLEPDLEPCEPLDAPREPSGFPRAHRDAESAGSAGQRGKIR